MTSSGGTLLIQSETEPNPSHRPQVVLFAADEVINQRKRHLEKVRHSVSTDFFRDATLVTDCHTQ